MPFASLLWVNVCAMGFKLPDARLACTAPRPLLKKGVHRKRAIAFYLLFSISASCFLLLYQDKSRKQEGV